MRLYLALLLSGMGCSSTDFLLVEARRSRNNRNNPRRKTMHLHPTPNPTTEPTAAPITPLPTFAPTQAPMSNPAGELSSEDGDAAAGTGDSGGVTTDSVNPASSSKPAPIYELQHGRGLFTIASGTGCYAGAKGQAQARFDVTSGSRVDLFVPTVSWIFEEDGPQDTMLKRLDDDSRRHLDIGDATTNTTDDHRKLDSSSASVCDMFHSGKDYFNIITLDLKRQPNPTSSNDAAGGSGGTLKDSTTTFHEHGSFQAREHWYQGVEGLYSLTCLFHECKMSFFFHIDDDGSAATTARRELLSDSGQEAEMTSLQLQGTTELAYEGAGTDRLVCVENCDVLGSAPVPRYSGVGTDAEFFEEINVRGFDNSERVVELQQTSTKAPKAAKGGTTTASPKAAKGGTTTTASPKAAKGASPKAAKGATGGTKAPKGGQPSPPGPSPTPIGTCADPDTTPPMAVCQDVTVDLPQSQTITITTAQVDNGSTDECGVSTLTLSTDTFNCANVGQNAITMTATDPSGNQGTCVSIVTVNDRPTAICRTSYTANLDGSGMVTVTNTDIDLGSSNVCNTALTYDVTPNTFTCTDVGNIQSVTLTVTSADGNTDTCTSAVTVADNTDPSAICTNGVTFQVDASGIATIDPNTLNGNSNDNCGTAALTFAASPTQLTCANVGNANVVTLTVTDAAGNSDSCSSTGVQVVDSIAPTAVCLASTITVALDATGNGAVTTTQIDAGSSDNCGPPTLTVENSSYDCADVGGANTATLRATDDGGLTDTCTTAVIVQDNIAPEAQCTDVSAVLVTGASPSVTIAASQVDMTSTDNCSIDTQTLSQSTFTCNDLGANLVTLTVTDPSSNTDTCRATVTITDGTDPTAQCRPFTGSLDGSGNLVVDPSSIDNGSDDDCNGPVTLSLDQTMFDCADRAAATTVTLTVTDESGNTATCTDLVTVQDTTPPDAVCLGSVVSSPYIVTLASAPTAGPYTQPPTNAPTPLDADVLGSGSTDNCVLATRTSSVPTVDCSDADTIVAATITATDDEGLSDTCVSNVQVLDNTAPTATCQDVTATLSATSPGQVTVSAETDVDDGSVDNCSIETYTINGSPSITFDCTDVGANLVSFQATDPSGRSAFCSPNPTVTVQDTTDPTVMCGNPTLNLVDDGLGGGTYTMAASELDNGSTDNCGITSFSVDDGGAPAATYTFDCTDVGVGQTLTLTATDPSGNSASTTLLSCMPVITDTNNVCP